MTTEELLAQLTDLDRLHAAGTDMSGKAPLAGARGLFINALLDGVDPEHPGVWPVLSSALKALATENAEWAQRYDRLQDERELAYVEVADLTDRLSEATALLTEHVWTWPEEPTPERHTRDCARRKAWEYIGFDARTGGAVNDTPCDERCERTLAFLATHHKKEAPL